MVPPLLAAALCAGAAATLASPLQRADVIHDPLWVLHVDADALRQSVVGQYLLAEMEKPEAQKKFAAFQAVFNFDPRRALHGLTLYGAARAEADGVLLVYADFDAARLTTLAEGAKDHQSAAHGRHTIHHWVDEKKKARDGVPPRTYAAIHGGKVVIFGQKLERVTEALDVLDRVTPSLATNPQFARLEGGTAFLQGAARKMDLPAGSANAAVFQQSRLTTLSVGETQRRLDASLMMEADSEEIARQIESVGRGLIGLLALQKDKPEATKLAQALTVRQAGASVTVGLSLPAEEVVEMLRAAAAKKQAAAP